MRILGIDPGLRTTGFGVLDVDGARLAYVASGVIRTHDAAQGDLPARLKLLFDGIGEVHARYQPQAAAVEIVFVNVNPQATLLLGQARGACVTALVHCGLPVAEYTALQMKKAVAGHGKAAKAQVQAMVQRLLQLPQAPGPDAADALGLAITHAHAGGTGPPARGRAGSHHQQHVSAQLSRRVPTGSNRLVGRPAQLAPPRDNRIDGCLASRARRLARRCQGHGRRRITQLGRGRPRVLPDKALARTAHPQLNAPGAHLHAEGGAQLLRRQALHPGQQALALRLLLAVGQQLPLRLPDQRLALRPRQARVDQHVGDAPGQGPFDRIGGLGFEQLKFRHEHSLAC